MKSLSFSTLNIDKKERTKYSSPSRCIYCLSDAQPLTDEHIVPFGLTGDAVVFEKASCKECARTINRYETRVLKQAVFRQRLQLDTPTRNPKDRPKGIPHEFALLDAQGSVVRTIKREFPWNESVLAHTGWRAPPAGILADRPPTEVIEGRPWQVCDQARAVKLCDEIRAESGHAGGVAFKIGDVHQGALLRFMAKTAHAYAVAELGLGRFKPLLGDIILNGSKSLTYLIGGPDEPEAVGDTNSFEMKCGECETDNGRYVVVWLRMFGLLGGPAYVAVAGELEAT